MKRIPLSDVSITKIQSDGQFLAFPIQESEYYRALTKSSEATYQLYLDRLVAYHYKRPITDADEMNYDQFESLFQDIKERGFDATREPRIKILNNEVIDGQHRVVIMFTINPNSIVEVNNKGLVTKWE